MVSGSYGNCVHFHTRKFSGNEKTRIWSGCTYCPNGADALRRSLGLRDPGTGCVRALWVEGRSQCRFWWPIVIVTVAVRQKESQEYSHS